MKTVAPTLSASFPARGFSLFEVLMVIAVIGVMASLAVPMISQSESAYAARDRRNAQELASTCAMAQAAGLDFVKGDDVLDTIRALVRGDMPAKGALKGHLFIVPGLSEEDMASASRYLDVDEGRLRYSTTRTDAVPGNQGL